MRTVTSSLPTGKERIYNGREDKKAVTDSSTCPELVSLLQYMKNITVRDERILDLNRIVEEVRKSEEWEAAR